MKLSLAPFTYATKREAAKSNIKMVIGSHRYGKAGFDIDYHPNGAKVEDAPDPRRPRANAVCCCFAAAIYCELWHALVYTRAGDWGILLFVRTVAFPKGKQNGEKKEHL